MARPTVIREAADIRHGVGRNAGPATIVQTRVGPRKTGPTTAAAPVDPADELRTLVTISRTHRDDVQMREVFVRLDGGRRMRLEFGESFTDEVRPGAHHLRVHNTLVWKNVHFTVEPGEHLEFVVVNVGFWWTYGVVGVLGSAPLFLRVEKRSLL